MPSLRYVNATARKEGFTLIELLVVIAIVSLLAAILFPVFGRVRENARRSSCQSNLKQIMLGVTQYTQDYDEKYPPLAIAGNVCGYLLIQPYVKSTKVFVCPSDTALAASSWCAASTYGSPFPTSYATNSLFSSNAALGAGSVYFAGIALNQLAQPSTTIYLADGISAVDNATSDLNWTKKTDGVWMDSRESSFVAPVISGGSPNRGGPLARHLETSGVGFADGHVKSIKIDSWYYNNTPWMKPSVGG